MTLGMTTTDSSTVANNPTATANQELSNTENNSDNDSLNKEGLANDDKTAVNDDELGAEDKNTVENQDNDDDEEVEIPEKFLNKDGTPNLKLLAKSYKELEPFRNKNAELSKQIETLSEKAKIAESLEQQQLEIAKAYGFNTVEDMQRHQQDVQVKSEMAKFEANQYAQFLNLCEDPEGARELLILYAQNPTPELKRAIEEEAGFPIEVHKKVAKEMVNLESEYQQKNFQLTYEQEATKVKAYLENVTTQYPEEFKNKEFVALYGEAFKALGTNLETDKFIGLLNGLKQVWISQHEAQKNQSQENNSAIEAIAGLSPSKNQPPQSNGGQEPDILSMSEEEMRKVINKIK